MNKKEIEITVKGKVQGVNFRRFVKERADERGVCGYVENVGEDGLEVVAQGNEEALEYLIAEIHKGPTFARIDEIKVTWHENLQDSFTDFEIW